MSDVAFEFRESSASQSEVYAHLSRCSHQFSPPLDQTVNLTEYAEKIAAKAVNFEAWAGGCLVALLACYFDEPGKAGYVTNVSVESDYMGRNIASSLLKACFRRALDFQVATISLEVSRHNDVAHHLYKKFGFEVERESSVSLFMKASVLN